MPHGLVSEAVKSIAPHAALDAEARRQRILSRYTRQVREVRRVEHGHLRNLRSPQLARSGDPAQRHRIVQRGEWRKLLDRSNDVGIKACGLHESGAAVNDTVGQSLRRRLQLRTKCAQQGRRLQVVTGMTLRGNVQWSVAGADVVKRKLDGCAAAIDR